MQLQLFKTLKCKDKGNKCLVTCQLKNYTCSIKIISNQLAFCCKILDLLSVFRTYSCIVHENFQSPRPK